MKSVSAPHTRLLAQKMSADVRHTGLWKRDLANSNITALLQSLHFFAFFATDSECREHCSSLSEFLPTKTQNFIINSLDAEVCGVKAQSIARECLDPTAHEGNFEILMFLQLYRLSASRFCNFIRCWCAHESSWTVGQMNSPALDFGRSLQRRGEICMESWGEIRWVTSILTISISSCLMTYANYMCMHIWVIFHFLYDKQSYISHIPHMWLYSTLHIQNLLFFSLKACCEAELDADKELQNLTFTAIIPAYPEASVQLPH